MRFFEVAATGGQEVELPTENQKIVVLHRHQATKPCTCIHRHTKETRKPRHSLTFSPSLQEIRSIDSPFRCWIHFDTFRVRKYSKMMRSVSVFALVSLLTSSAEAFAPKALLSHQRFETLNLQATVQKSELVPPVMDAAATSHTQDIYNEHVQTTYG